MSEPIIAYRLWALTSEGRLKTKFRNHGKWPWMKPYSAWCDKELKSGDPYTHLMSVYGFKNNDNPITDHDAPHFDCHCGLYGFRDISSLSQTFTAYNATSFLGGPPFTYAVLGRVALWGRVVEHETGYRAEYGYPQTLFLSDDVPHNDLIRAAAQKYGIDCVPMPQSIVDALGIYRAEEKRKEEEKAKREIDVFGALGGVSMSDYQKRFWKEWSKPKSGKTNMFASLFGNI